MKSEEDTPVAVEFSFKYENKKEDYDGESAQGIHNVFGRLEDKLTLWIDPDGLTKTALVYSKAS